MVRFPDDIEALVGRDKILGRSPAWDEKSDPRYSTLTAPLRFEFETTSEFQIRAKFSKQHPNRDAMLQLEYAPSGLRAIVPLWRIEWRPFGSHTNGDAPPDLPFRNIEGSHQHSFADNFLVRDSRMSQGNLPAARGLNPDPTTASNFIAYSGGLFRIRDIERLKLPETVGDLFWNANG